MSHGRLSHLRCLELLLVVLALQGITPDAQDLASIHAFQLFAPLLNDLDSPAQQDEWPDDVCDPVQSATCLHPTPGEKQAWPSTFRLATIEVQLQLFGLNSFRSGTRRGVAMSSAGLVWSLERLTC
jgi:hypothetical protein